MRQMRIDKDRQTNSNIDPWDITPERQLLTENLGNKWQEQDLKMKTATPIDPNSGEQGIFSKYSIIKGQLHPMYITENGTEFFLPENHSSQNDS